MMKDTAEAAFKPKPTVSEKRGDTTTRAAQQIIDAERGDRDAKTARLRRARLEQRRAEPIAIGTPKARSRKRLLPA